MPDGDAALRAIRVTNVQPGTDVILEVATLNVRAGMAHELTLREGESRE